MLAGQVPKARSGRSARIHLGQALRALAMPQLLTVMLAVAPAAGQAPAPGAAGPDDPILATGLSALRARDLASAEKSFRQALARSPSSNEALAGLGLSLLEQGRAGEAVGPLTQARQQRPGVAAIHFALGRALFQGGQHALAAASFDSVRSLKADWPDIGYYLGVSHFRAGGYTEAMDAFRRGPVSSAWARESARLHEGTALARLGRAAEARELLTELLREARVPDIAGGARIALSSLAGGPRHPRTRGSIRIGQQYDTNATVVPTTNVFGLRDQKHASGGTAVNMQLVHDVKTTARHSLALAYSLLQTLNYRIPDVNAQDHTLTLEGGWAARVGRRQGRVTVPLIVDHLLLDEASFLHRTALAPGLTVLSGNGHATTVQLGATHKDYLRQRDNEGTTEDRDAWNYALGVTHEIPLAGRRWRGNIGVTHDAEVTQGANLDYDGVRVAAGAGGRIGGTKLDVQVQAQHHDRRYRNQHSFFRTRRHDDETTLYAMLAYRLSDRRILTLAHLNDRTRSNIALYSFDKAVTTAALRFSF